MAEADNTLAGLVQMNDMNLADIEVSDLLLDAPLLAAMYAVPASNGTLHKYTKETTAPGASFRDVNTGRANAAPQETLVTVTLKLLDASFERDKALGLGYSKGKEAYMAKQAAKSLKAAFAEVEQQIINGTGNDASGFTGLANAIDELGDNMMVNATGTASGTIKTSVYVLRSDEDNVAVVAGNDGNIDVGEIYETTINTDDTDDTKLLSCLALAIMGWMGLQIGSVYSACRIANVTDESGKGVTDDLLASAIAKFPVGKRPNLIAMNRTALEQLRASRTATNATGAPAPAPAEAFGIPIVVTDQIGNAESIVTTTTTTTGA